MKRTLNILLLVAAITLFSASVAWAHSAGADAFQDPPPPQPIQTAIGVFVAVFISGFGWVYVLRKDEQ